MKSLRQQKIEHKKKIATPEYRAQVKREAKESEKRAKWEEANPKEAREDRDKQDEFGRLSNYNKYRIKKNLYPFNKPRGTK